MSTASFIVETFTYRNGVLGGYDKRQMHTETIEDARRIQAAEQAKAVDAGMRVIDRLPRRSTSVVGPVAAVRAWQHNPAGNGPMKWVPVAL